MKYLNNQKGSALVLTIILLTVVTILGIAMLSSVVNEVKINKAIETRLIARYLAQAGIEHSLNLIETDSELVFPYEEVITLGNRNRMYNIKITKLDTEYKIESKGIIEINGAAEQLETLEATVTEDGKVIVEE